MKRGQGERLAHVIRMYFVEFLMKVLAYRMYFVEFLMKVLAYRMYFVEFLMKVLAYRMEFDSIQENNGIKQHNRQARL
jgi:hypothetical protein